MKVLVTGSEGFIGGYIVKELINKGYEVVGIDNLSKYGKLVEVFQKTKIINLYKMTLKIQIYYLKKCLIVNT